MYSVSTVVYSCWGNGSAYWEHQSLDSFQKSINSLGVVGHTFNSRLRQVDLCVVVQPVLSMDFVSSQ